MPLWFCSTTIQGDRLGRESAETCFFRPFRERFWPFRGCHGPGDRYPNRQLKTKSGHVWLFAGSQPHSLHSLKRFFWRRSIVINHLGGKGASPALPSAPPCTEAPRSRPRPKALGFRDRSVNTVERRHRTKSVLTHYKAGIPSGLHHSTEGKPC